MSRLNKTVVNVGVFALAAALVFLAARVLLAAVPMWSAMMSGGMMGDGMMGGSGWLGMLPMLLLWGGVLSLLAWLLFGLFTGDGREKGSGASGDAAEAALRERFARGEISAEEYQRRLQTLRAQTQHVKTRHEDREGGSRGAAESEALPQQRSGGSAGYSCSTARW